MTVLEKNLFVFTDLDGTLLSFRKQEFKSIKPFISNLNSRGVHLIPNSSKCFSEILPLMVELELRTPFITENGAAIFIPNDYLEKKPIEAKEFRNYWVIKLGTEKEIINNKIKHSNFKEFSKYSLFLKNMTQLQQSYYTGIKLGSLKEGLLKEYGEPFIWMGNKEKLEEFKHILNEEGLSITTGARLLHLTGLNSKGDAMSKLLEELKLQGMEDIATIACGDSPNDISMLELADYAVVIRLPDKKNMVLSRRSNISNSKKIAPEGWKEELEEIDLIKNILK